MMFIQLCTLEICIIGFFLVMFKSVRNLILRLLIFSTIQKTYYRQSVDFTMAGFADALKPEKFAGVHFKRWQVKVRLWLIVMHAWEARTGIPEDVKEMWHALVAKYDATDPGSELYTMESFHDYSMVNNRSVLEQAHEIQVLVKELELLKCPLPDKFVVGRMIAKLPSSWRNFATTLKHKRQEISVENLIASLDVEEKARAKDASEKGGGAHSSANMVQKNKGKKKGKTVTKPNKTTTFKKNKTTNAKGACFTCGNGGHFARVCPYRVDRKEKASKDKDVNMVTVRNTGDGSLGVLPS
ncbi:retrotransposon protein, putative, Ty1-copia subclass, expressed [Panicum miliaceum]|uniref:Retrotransposon protein, putative, Ty1-copia subclass, expressed n=1 Tax=Panicum miliaceum TaxID=4540 RepID=A0A3L6T690_PANMI|nr:retrotransposon protein, putative, Ty1-copia subclass, expressed [Panicum miliaceum]